VIEDGRIAGLGSEADLGHGLPRTDLGGALVAPGLVDLHQHGAMGSAYDCTGYFIYPQVIIA
jgi:cytosine/adenosine deaminase-related metal-dependent hydrolase